MATLARALASGVRHFRARCESRAILFGAGEIELCDAVDVLQAAAIASGLVEDIGQDAVQALMAQAFKLVRDV
jgi:hypothetical protein